MIKTNLILWGLFISCTTSLSGQQDSIWTLDMCINYALDKNIQVQKAKVSNDISQINLAYAKSVWYPSLSGSVRENLDWSNQLNTTTGSTVFKGTDGMNLSLNSGMTLFNGNKIHNSVRKAEIDYEADKYNTEVIKETISLNVLNAYLQVLYAEEQVKNIENQISSLEEQLNLASERLKLGVISNSDYLQVKSQLATEKQTLATSNSQLALDKITLMQLMELPEPNEISIERPNLDSLLNQKRRPDPREVYQISLQIKPEVKNAELSKKSSEISVDLARANYFPNLSLNAGVSTLYSTTKTGSSIGYQIKDNLSPAIGVTASIPIYLNTQVRTNVAIAKGNTSNAGLDELNVKNQLRKAIEQACQDVISSQIEYEASAEAYKAAKESYEVASEKYFNGLMNSVDFLIQKTSFISAESSFLQSKYRLIFSYKILDFYSGQPLSFKNMK
ncbi:MAG: TolC family protein [Bacteroidota bacterium]|nr:TolC family protein [Bacteroidota bacterium]